MRRHDRDVDGAQFRSGVSGRPAWEPVGFLGDWGRGDTDGLPALLEEGVWGDNMWNGPKGQSGRRVRKKRVLCNFELEKLDFKFISHSALS